MCQPLLKVPISGGAKPAGSGNRRLLGGLALSPTEPGNPAAAGVSHANRAFVEIGRSLSQGCHVAKRDTEANSRFTKSRKGLTLGPF